MKKISTASYNAWSGYAFETVCLHHIDQIVEGLDNQYARKVKKQITVEHLFRQV